MRSATTCSVSPCRGQYAVLIDRLFQAKICLKNRISTEPLLLILNIWQTTTCVGPQSLVLRLSELSQRTGDSQFALKPGTVTPGGGFTAHPDGFEAELTDKPLPQRAKSVDRAK